MIFDVPDMGMTGKHCTPDTLRVRQAVSTNVYQPAYLLYSMSHQYKWGVVMQCKRHVCKRHVREGLGGLIQLSKFKYNLVGVLVAAAGINRWRQDQQQSMAKGCAV